MGKQSWKAGNMVYPVPAVMVSCQRPGEKPNIITVAWCGTICTSPAMLSVSIRPERHSYDIIKQTGEFVVNLVTKNLTFATDYCGVRSGRDVDKFKEMKLTPLASNYVAAPGIEECPVNIECKVKEILELGSHHMFIAEVQGVTIDEKYMDENGKFHLNKSGLVAYSHGEYFELGEKCGKFGYSVKKKTMDKNTVDRNAIDPDKTGRSIVNKNTTDKDKMGRNTVDKNKKLDRNKKSDREKTDGKKRKGKRRS